MVTVAEEIEIGLDASDALKGLGDIGKAFENLSRQAGINQREMNRANQQIERGIATVTAAMAKQAATRKQDLRTINEEITAEEKLAAAKRGTYNAGLRENSSGRLINAGTGRFASAAEVSTMQNQIALAERLSQRTEDLRRQRERSARQQQLETVFAKQFYGTADQGASRLQRVANIMRQIPPATWTRSLGEASSKIMDMGNSARYALYDVSTTFGVAGAAIAGLGVLAINAAVQHERAFANVARTTQTTAQGYEQLRRQLEVMSMEIPVSFEGLTDIATAAGQLGIGASGVAAFTGVVAKLSATTNLTADAAGIALARFRAFFSEAEDPALAVTEATFTNLASAILKVGVNSIASETGIVNVAVQIASMADYAGYTAEQVIGLAGALSSIGVAPELARGTITRTFSLIGNAVSNGGIQLEKFANLAGVSSSTFRQAWGTDEFAGVFTKLVGGIRELGNSGQDANLALMELGFNSVRDRPLLLRLAEAADEAGNSGGLLAQTMRDAEQGWRENSELALQYTKISQTTAARLQVLGQAFEQLASSMGQQSGGFLGEVATQLTGVIRGFEELSNTDAGQFLGSFVVQATLAIGGLALLIAGAARAVASLQGIGVAFREMQGAGVAAMTKLAASFRILNLSLGIVGIISTIGLAVTGLIAMNDASNKAARGLQDTAGLVQAMGRDAESGANGMTFYAKANREAVAEQKATEATAEGMAEALYGVKAAGETGAAGMDSLSEATEKARYVFGSAAEEFYKSQLLQSEGFQRLFNPDTKFARTELDNFFGQGLSLKELGLDPADLDWDKFIRDSLDGGVDTEKLMQDLAKKLDISKYNKDGDLTKRWVSLQSFVDSIGTSFQDVGGDVQGLIDSTSALSLTGAQAFQEYSEGAITAAELVGQLDETTQKVVDKMAGGMVKFVDTAKLIKITQDQSTQTAKEYEEAWTTAFGGSSFSLGEYLANFKRAAAEQQTFITNLQQLSAAGVSTSIIADLAAMGPEANRLVQAMVDDLNTTGGEGLAQFEELWGQTGYDSMVAFAVQAQLGQMVINNIMSDGGYAALKAFNAALSTGMGVDAALASIQRDMDGKKLKPKVDKPPTPPNLTAWEKQQWAMRNRLSTTATVRVSAINGGAAVKIGGKLVTPDGFAAGGYTGPGGKYDARGIVHADEFVFTKEATRAIGVGNLYSMMNAATNGRSAPRGRGYASGGAVGGGGPNVVYLSPEDRALLSSLQPIVRIGNRDIAQASAEASFRSTREGV